MKVKELVAELLKVDQEAEVVRIDTDGGGCLLGADWDVHVDEVLVRVDGRVQLS